MKIQKTEASSALPLMIMKPMTDDTGDNELRLTTEDGTDGEEDEVGWNNGGRVEQLHGLVEKPTETSQQCQ